MEKTAKDYPHGPRGFASPKFDKDYARLIARLGGRKAHENGKAHRWTSDEARAAGQKGAATRRANKRRVA